MKQMIITVLKAIDLKYLSLHWTASLGGLVWEPERGAAALFTAF
jgi:hypothetical protein